jgi:hypothetical protein
VGWMTSAPAATRSETTGNSPDIRLHWPKIGSRCVRRCRSRRPTPATSRPVRARCRPPSAVPESRGPTHGLSLGLGAASALAVRVRITSRSTPAKPPRKANINRPVLVPVSAHRSAKDRNCALASTCACRCLYHQRAVRHRSFGDPWRCKSGRAITHQKIC